MYGINLTSEDINAIYFVGNRYEWSKSLMGLEIGLNHLTESEAWEFKLSADSDDSFLTLLDPESKLYAKLTTRYINIV